MAEMIYLQWLRAQQLAEREQYRQMLEFISYPVTSHTPPPIPTLSSQYLPPYPEEITDLDYTAPFDPDQIPRHSISPPLIPEDRPQPSQKRRKPQLLPPKAPSPPPLHSAHPFGVDEEGALSSHSRPPPIQINGTLYEPPTYEGYLTPPLTSKCFSPPITKEQQGPFGGYTSPIMVPSDIITSVGPPPREFMQFNDLSPEDQHHVLKSRRDGRSFSNNKLKRKREREENAYLNTQGTSITAPVNPPWLQSRGNLLSYY